MKTNQLIEIKHPRTKNNFICRSENIQKTIAKLKVMAPFSDSMTALVILGEKGCNKDFYVRYFCKHSKRKIYNKIFCEVLNDYLESRNYLFGLAPGGYEGHFITQKGLIEKTNNGLLHWENFDHINNTPIQSMSTRYFHENIILNPNYDEVSLDILNVITSTQDFTRPEFELTQILSKKRIKTIKIHPLRERKIDIKMIANSLLYGEYEYIHEEAMDMLLNHEWPGNDRELKDKIRDLSTIKNGDRDEETITPIDIEILLHLNKKSP